MPSVAFQRVEQALAARGTPLRHGRAPCPAHGGQDPNLAVDEGAEAVLVHCHSHGCTAEAIAGALGLTLGDLRIHGNGNGHGHGMHALDERTAQVIEYDYVDPDGTLRYRVRRTERPWLAKADAAHKEVRPYTPAGTPGRGGAPALLYQLPELLEAIAEGKRVHVVEGENKVEELRARGLVATTSGGAKSWTEDLAARHRHHFQDADVVILPDHDEPGRAYARAVADSLLGIAARIRIVELPGLPPKGDVVDFFAAGGTVAQLEAAIAAAAAFHGGATDSHTCFSLADLLGRPELLQPPARSVPRLGWKGRSTMFAALEKRGKSTLLCGLAAAKSRGRHFLGEDCTAGTVLLVWLEEHLGEVVQRLRLFGADPARVYIVPRLSGGSMAERLAEIRAHAMRLGAEVVILDSLTRLSEGLITDARSSAEMHPVVQGLTSLAHDSELTVIFSHHMKKDGSGYRDSSAIGAAVDMIAEMTEPDEKSDPTRRLVRLRGRFATQDFEYRFDGEVITLVARDEVSLDIRIRDIISAQPGISLRGLRAVAPGRNEAIDAAVRHLLERELIVDRGSGNGHRYYAPDAPSESAKSLRGNSGHGLVVRQEAQTELGVPEAKSLWGKGGHGVGTVQGTALTPDRAHVPPTGGHSGHTGLGGAA